MRSYKLLAIIIGIALGILFMEVIMRVYFFRKFSSNNLIISKNAYLIFEHRPNMEFFNSYGIKVKYNSLGFFGKETTPKEEGVFRIFGTGDSITDATYLPENERYLNRLAFLLNQKERKAVDIINGAVGGYNTWQELELIKCKGLSVHPDLIIVGICLNDFVNNKPNLKKSSFNRITENIRDGSKARYFNGLYQKSDLYKFVYDFLSIRKIKKYSEGNYTSYLESYNFEIRTADFEKWKEPFLGMMKLAKENNIKILFVIFPLKNEVISKKDFSCKMLSDFFTENNASYIDLIKDFNKHSALGENMYYKRDMIHPSSLGHKVAADSIASYVLKIIYR